MAAIESISRWGNRFNSIVQKAVRILIYIRLWQVKHIYCNLVRVTSREIASLPI